MPELSSFAPTALSPRPAPVTDGIRELHPSLVIGAKDIDAKEQLLLRSLVRLLDKTSGLRLQFSDTASSCNVVFVPAHGGQRLHSECITVQVLESGSEKAASSTEAGLTVTAPLRMSNVTAVLHAAADLLAGGARAAVESDGLADLFHLLTRHLMARDRRTTVVPLVDGRQLLIDFPGERFISDVPLDELFGGRYRLGESRRATSAEDTDVLAMPALRLRDLLWTAAHRLGSAGASGDGLRGSYLLTRWPDAVALARPGFPRLAALLTSRAMTVEQVSQASGTSVAAVCRFLEVSLALGTAVLVEGSGSASTKVSEPTGPTRSLLGRLRDRLKLW